MWNTVQMPTLHNVQWFWKTPTRGMHLNGVLSWRRTRTNKMFHTHAVIKIKAIVSTQFLTMHCFSQLASIWILTLHKVLNKVVSTINFVQSCTFPFCSFYFSICSLFLNIVTGKNKYDPWCLLGFVKCTARTYMAVCDPDCHLLGYNLVGRYQHFRGTCFLHL